MLLCETIYFNSNHSKYFCCTAQDQLSQIFLAGSLLNISWLIWIVGNGGTRLDRMRVWEIEKSSLSGVPHLDHEEAPDKL